MGDFVGGMLKYLRAHPVPRLSLAGGFAKLAKLAQGALDLHSAARGSTSRGSPASRAAAGAPPEPGRRPSRPPTRRDEILAAPTAAGFPLADLVAARTRATAQAVVGGTVRVEVVVVDRQGGVSAGHRAE